MYFPSDDPGKHGVSSLLKAALCSVREEQCFAGKLFSEGICTLGCVASAENKHAGLGLVMWLV